MPRSLATALTLHIVSLVTGGFPPDTAHVPEGLFKTAGVTTQHPAARVRFHAFTPARGKDRFEKLLHPTHLVISRLFL